VSANDDLLQALLERDKAMDDWTADELATLLAVMETAHTEALGYISTHYKQGDIATITAEVDAVYLAAATKIKAAIEADLPKLASEEGAFIRVLLGDVAKGAEIKSTAIAWADIAAKPIAGSTLGQLADALGVNNAVDVVAETQRALEQGKSLDELVRTLRGDVVTRAKWAGGKYIPGVYEGGVMTTDTRQTEMFARTAVMHVGNAAREAYYKANEDIIKGYQRVETLDDRTCIECGVEDGHVYDVGAPRPFLPCHANCRGLYVPVLKSYRELGYDIDELPAGTRASMDGQVPRYKTWRDVVAEADAKRQDAILGPTRAALYRGGMKLDEFIKDGKLVPLKELRK